MSASAQRRAATAGPWLLAGASALLAAALCWPTEEDAFIYFRYALHSARGLGLVFNPGEPVEGFSSPLWMAVLAAGARLSGAVHALARALGVLCGAATVLATARLGRDAGLGPGWRLGAAACVAFDYWFLVWAQSGLETPLYALLLTLGAAAYVRAAHGPEGVAGRLEVAGLLAGAAALGRPEGALLGLAALADQLVRGAPLRSVARFALPAAVVAAPYVLWRRVSFGAWLPNTSVKIHTLHVDRSLQQAWELALFLGVVALVLPALAWRRRSPGPLPAALRWLWIAGLVLSFGFHFAVGGDYRAGFRYLVPALPLLLVAAWGAAERLLARAPARRALAALLAATLLSGSLVAWLGDPWRRWRPGAIAAQWTDPHHGAPGAGRWILDHVPERSLVAYGQMGRVPYLCAYEGHDVRFLDTVGLVDRGVAGVYRLDRKLRDLGAALAGGVPIGEAHERGRASRVAAFVAHVLAREPDFVIVEPYLEHAGLDALVASPEFERRYREVASFRWEGRSAERIYGRVARP